MPELPEVEVVRRGLSEHVVGLTVESVEVLHPRATRRHLGGPADFSSLLRLRRIESARRRGKYLWLPLDSGDAVLAHLGMSGQLLVQPAHAPDERHLRARFRFVGTDVQLRFVDQRTFGGLAVASGGAELPTELRHIARDPADPLFDDAGFVTAIRRRHTELKRALLDQTLVSGIGNIYADEALWGARLHYATPTDRLTKTQATAVLEQARAVMAAALDQGGTSFDALYVNVNGASGYFDRSLETYGQQGKPCSRCETPIVREAFMNRSSHFCPNCQRRPSRQRTR